MIEPRSVVHFSIAVSDLNASRKFYTEILGLTLVHDTPAAGMVFLRAGADHVILAKSDAPLRREPKDSRRAHHAFKVDPEKYEAAKVFLASKGVEVFEEEDRKKTNIATWMFAKWIARFIARDCFERHDLPRAEKLTLGHSGWVPNRIRGRASIIDRPSGCYR